MRMRIFFCALVFCFIAPQLHTQESQPRWFLGVVGGFNNNYQSGIFSLPDSNGVEVKTPGKSAENGSMFGLAGEYWYANNGAAALQFNIYYERKPGAFRWTGTPVTFFDTNSGQTFIYSRDNEVEANYDLLNFEVFFRYNVISHCGISIGPKVGIAVHTQYSQIHFINHIQGNFLFPEETLSVADEMVTPMEHIPDVYLFHFAMNFRLQYELLFGNFLITPAISYDYGITKIAPGWRVSTLAGTVDVKYGL